MIMNERLSGFFKKRQKSNVTKSYLAKTIGKYLSKSGYVNFGQISTPNYGITYNLCTYSSVVIQKFPFSYKVFENQQKISRFNF